MRGDRPVIRAIRGPIILITVGVLFALQNLTSIGFDQTWPVLLIVIGLLSLFGRAVQPPPPPRPPVNPAVPPPPHYQWQPPTGYPTPSYSQSRYAQPAPGTATPPGTGPGSASGAAKGGFGSSAPVRDNPPSGSPPRGSV